MLDVSGAAFAVVAQGASRRLFDQSMLASKVLAVQPNLHSPLPVFSEGLVVFLLVALSMGEKQVGGMIKPPFGEGRRMIDFAEVSTIEGLEATWTYPTLLLEEGLFGVNVEALTSATRQ